jgi:hypothetical protein
MNDLKTPHVVISSSCNTVGNKWMVQYCDPAPILGLLAKAYLLSPTHSGNVHTLVCNLKPKEPKIGFCFHYMVVKVFNQRE